GLQAPFEEPRGLVLLRRDEADDVLVQTLGDLVLFDGGDEAVLVLLSGQLLDRVVFLGHAYPFCAAAARREPPFHSTGEPSNAMGCVISASVMRLSASRTTLMIFIQLLFTMHDFSMPQSLDGAQQSVMPIGPSRAPMTWAIVMASGFRDSVK